MPQRNDDPKRDLDRLPDVRDGLTRVERVVLVELQRLQAERPGRYVPSAQLYGRVVQYVNLTPKEFEALLSRLAGRFV